MAKSILITGCSSGIGRHTARTLNSIGYHVVASVRKIEDLEALQAEGIDTVLIDLNDDESITKGLDAALEKTEGKLDALFNNAGFLQAGAVEDMTREIDQQQFATNVFGSMQIIRETLKIMRRQGHGRIIQNSSILGIIPLAYCGCYNASKFALEGYCNTLRLELRNTNIHLSLINPGAIESNLRQTAKAHFEQHIDAQHSQHQNAYDKLKRAYFAINKKPDPFCNDANILIKPLLHALENKHPKAHYYPGFASKSMAMLRRLLPDRFLDIILNRIR